MSILAEFYRCLWDVRCYHCYLCTETSSALEEACEHDTVPLVCTVVLQASVGVVAGHDPADVLTQPVPAEELLLQGHTLPLHLAVQALTP